ncbi:hypothetical protein FKM82_017110 [Ascaphus truei]
MLVLIIPLPSNTLFLLLTGLCLLLICLFVYLRALFWDLSCSLSTHYHLVTSLTLLALGIISMQMIHRYIYPPYPRSCNPVRSL